MKTVLVKGPAGVYEKKLFQLGTKGLLEVVASSKSFSLVGGGDTSTAVEKLGLSKERFSYVSISGGALITFLSGGRMPGIEALTFQA